jgi:hypothetical protein
MYSEKEPTVLTHDWTNQTLCSACSSGDRRKCAIRNILKITIDIDDPKRCYQTGLLRNFLCERVLKSARKRKLHRTTAAASIASPRIVAVLKLGNLATRAVEFAGAAGT